jgi:hypothetical protein
MILIFEIKHTKGLHVLCKMEAKRKKGGGVNKLCVSLKNRH